MSQPAGVPERPKSKIMWAIVIVVILIIAAVGIAWVAGVFNKKEEQKEKVLVIAMSSNVETMDPGKTSAMYGPPGMILETLITRDKTGAYQPGLAESYVWDETNPLAPTFTMHLKHGVTFHDNTPFNAQAVKDNVKWYKEPDPDGRYGWVSYEFAAIDCAAGANPVGDMNKGVWVKDDYTIVFNCTFKDVALIFNLSHLYGSIHSPTALYAAGATVEQAHLNYGTPNHPAVGTGPMKLTEWIADDHVTLTKFKNHTWGFNWYTNQGPAKIDKIIYRIIADESTRFAAFESGDIDVLMQVPPSKVTKYASDSNMTVITGPGQGTYHVEFNCQKGQWTNASLRRAFGFAIDRQQIVTSVWHGYAEPGVNYLSPIEPEGRLIPAQYNYSYNTVKALELFAAGGYVNEDSDVWLENTTTHAELSLPLWTTNKGEDVAMGTILKSQFEAIGCHVTLTQYAENNLRSRAAAGEQDAILFWYSWPRAEILDWHFGTWAAGGSNTGWYEDPVFDAYVTNWTYAPTDAAFSENATRAHERLLMMGPWAPIIFWHQIVAVHNYVTGWYAHPLGQEQVIDVSDVDINK